MNFNCVIFAATSLKREEIEGKRVLEAGSLDVNGSVRPIIESNKPKEYIGIDIAPGKGVDSICDVREIVAMFGPDSFDLIIATELLEHVRDWRSGVHNIKTACRPGGVMLITTRSAGFPYHGYPHDFWRYELEDMKAIFRDCGIERLEKDSQKGVFIKAVKPERFAEADLSGHALYSMVTGTRAETVRDADLKSLYFRQLVLRQKLRESIDKAARFISGRI